MTRHSLIDVCIVSEAFMHALKNFPSFFNQAQKVAYWAMVLALPAIAFVLLVVSIVFLHFTACVGVLLGSIRDGLCMF